MRRTARLALSVLAASTLVLTPAMVGTSAAAPAKGSSASQSAKAGQSERGKQAKPAKPAKPAKQGKPAKPGKQAKPSKAKSKVTVVGIVTDTPTVTTAPGSATSTVTIRVAVQGGDREYKGRTVTVSVPSSATVKRNHGKKSRYELKKGDKVTVHARRDAAGALTATYVAASGRQEAKPVASEPAASSTATTR